MITPQCQREGMKHRFRPGQSGNPAGRPPSRYIKSRIREQLNGIAGKVLDEIADDIAREQAKPTVIRAVMDGTPAVAMLPLIMHHLAEQNRKGEIRELEARVQALEREIERLRMLAEGAASRRG